MGKQIWKPGNMVYPLPAVMVSTADTKGNDNIITGSNIFAAAFFIFIIKISPFK